MEKAILSAANVVTSARAWVGTRFRHQGRKRGAAGKGGGCDCLGLLVGVAEELALHSCDGRLLARFDERDYGHFPDGSKLRAMLDSLLMPIGRELLAPGDVLLLRFDNAPQHLAIVSDYNGDGLGVIHALAAARAVVEHRLDALWESRIVEMYRLPELA